MRIRRLELRVRPPIAASAAILLLVVLFAIFAGFLPFDPERIDLSSALDEPRWPHVLGTDELGRDLLTRIAFGARASLGVSVGAVLLAGLLGTTIGLAAGYLGGAVDAITMQAVNVAVSFPAVLLALLLIAIVGPELQNIVLAIALQSLPGYIRLVRAAVLSVRQNAYIEAARSIGCRDARIARVHILPNIVGPISVQSTFLMAGAIQLTSGLSFLGIGVRPPTPEWGSILAGGRGYLAVAPHITLAPGLVLFVVLIALNLLGDALRDALDPRLRRRARA